MTSNDATTVTHKTDSVATRDGAAHLVVDYALGDSQGPLRQRFPLGVAPASRDGDQMSTARE